MEQSKTRNEDHICFKHICARAGMWGLLFIGLLAVCCSLPMIALAL